MGTGHDIKKWTLKLSKGFIIEAKRLYGECKYSSSKHEEQHSCHGNMGELSPFLLQVREGCVPASEKPRLVCTLEPVRKTEDFTFTLICF